MNANSEGSKAPWKRWLGPGRVVALLTIVGAGAAVVLDVLGVMALDVAEEVIIALLGLLAIDALTERISVLERIEKELSVSAQSLRLEGREEFSVPLEERLANAGEVCVLGVNLVGILAQYQGLITAKAREGCAFRIMVADPEFFDLAGLQASWYGDARSKRNVEYTAFAVDKIRERGGKDKVELRYLPFPPPYSLLMIDPEKASGQVQVEFYTYEHNANKRPHLTLTRDVDRRWYDFFRKEFDLAWEVAQETG